MTTDYDTRRRGLLAALTQLPTDPAAYGLTPAMLDQHEAAQRDAFADLRRFHAAASTLQPGRFHSIGESDDPAAFRDTQARVLAAMGDGHWTWCNHLRRTPAQPTHVQLPLRRVDCRRCAQTRRKPPAHEADRCDLCGSHGHATFWPFMTTLRNWTVGGDICHDCAEPLYAHLGSVP